MNTKFLKTLIKISDKKMLSDLIKTATKDSFLLANKNNIPLNDKVSSIVKILNESSFDKNELKTIIGLAETLTGEKIESYVDKDLNNIDLKEFAIVKMNKDDDNFENDDLIIIVDSDDNEYRGVLLSGKIDLNDDYYIDIDNIIEPTNNDIEDSINILIKHGNKK